MKKRSRTRRALLVGAPPPTGPSTADPHVLQAGVFGLKTLEVGYRLQVHLPPDYHKSRESYPLLYMFDGQNAFDAATAFLGQTWNADETHDRLVAEGKIRPHVIAALWSIPARISLRDPRLMPGRNTLFTPVRDPLLGGGRIDLLEKLLFEEVDPHLRGRFRLQAGASATGVLGSSLGGLGAFHLAWRNPGRFGKAGVVSPSLWWAGECTLKMVQGGRGPSRMLRFWLDMGSKENEVDFELPPGVEVFDADWDPVESVKALGRALEERGHDVRCHIAEGARHSELAWRERLPLVLQWLFPAAEGA